MRNNWAYLNCYKWVVCPLRCQVYSHITKSYLKADTIQCCECIKGDEQRETILSWSAVCCTGFGEPFFAHEQERVALRGWSGGCLRAGVWRRSSSSVNREVGGRRGIIVPVRQFLSTSNVRAVERLVLLFVTLSRKHFPALATFWNIVPNYILVRPKWPIVRYVLFL